MSGKKYSYRYSYGYGYERERDKRPRRLNRRLFLASVLVLALAAPAVYLWHRHQLHRLSGALLDHADHMESQGRWSEAADSLYRYWRIRPEPTALGRLAQNYDKAEGARNRAGVINSYQRAIGVLPHRNDLRTRLSELLLGEGLHALALEQATKVLADEPRNPAARKWQALAGLGGYRHGASLSVEDVLVDLEQAYQLQPADHELAEAIAELIRGDMRAAGSAPLARRADEVMDRLVVAAPRDAHGFLARHKYRLRHGLDGADDDIRRALELAPKDPAINIQGAWNAHRNRNWLVARSLFQQVIELRPGDENGYLGWGAIELNLNHPEESLRIWELGRERVGTSLPLLLRLAEVRIQLRQLDKAKETIAEIDRAVSRLATQGAEADRDRATASAALLHAQCRLADEHEDPRAAIPFLKTAASLGGEVSDVPDGATPLAFSAHKRLGEVLGRIGQWEDAAASFEQSLKWTVDVGNTSLAAAEAWGRVGLLDRAILLSEQALQAADAPSRAPLRLAQFLFERQLQFSPVDRNWSSFETAFQTARETLPDAWELEFLEIDYRLEQDGPAGLGQALGRLWSLEQERPDDVAFWRGLVLVYETLGQFEEADRALLRLDELTGSSSETKILWADVLLARDKTDEVRHVLQAIPRGQLSLQERRDLDFARLRLVEANGDLDALSQELRRITDLYPEQSFTLEQSLDVEFDADSTPRGVARGTHREPSDVSELVRQLRERQGETQSDWRYYESRRLLRAEWNATSHAEVIEHLRFLENSRPHWTKTHELAGRLAVLDGGYSEAISAWERAILLSTENLEARRLLVDGYVAAANYQSLWTMLDDWGRRPALSRVLYGGSSGFASRHTRLAHAMRATRTAQEGDPPDNHADTRVSQPASPTIWAALLCAQQKRWDEAHAILDQVLTRDPGQIAAHMTRLKLRVDAGDSARAKETLLDLARQAVFSDEDLKSFVMGQASQLLGDLAAARQAFHAVSQDSPYRMRSELWAQRAIETPVAAPLDVAARSRPTADARSRRRLEAVVRLRRSGKHDLVAARDLLRALVESGGDDARATVGDRALLSSCLERLGDRDAARAQLELAVAADSSAQSLADLVEFLLRADAAADATPWLEKLERQSGDALRTVSLRSRWILTMGQRDAIKPLLESFAQRQIPHQSEEDLPELMREIAWIYEDALLDADAERWRSLLADRFPGWTERLPLRPRTGDDATDRAIRLTVEQLRKEASPEAAAALATAIVFREVSPDTRRAVVPILDDILARFPHDGRLLFAIGNLRLRMGQLTEAVELLTRATEVQPGHYLAWNNLAALLAEQPGRNVEAMDAIEQALEAAGYKIPTLMDTKAVVLMHQTRFEEASELLKIVTRSRLANDPRFFFHQALALSNLNQDEEAREALSEAENLGLDQTFLTSTEQEAWRQLKEKYLERAL